MPKKNSKFPKDVVNVWPEILEDIDIQVIPTEYLESIKVTFSDGKIWDIDVKKTLEKPDVDIDLALQDLFNEYEDVIQHVDFRLNTVKVKRDITARTKLFMKKRR